MDEREVKKQNLEKTISNATDAIKNQLSDYKDKGKDILLVGGIIMGAYAIYKLFSDEEESTPNTINYVEKEKSVIGSALTGVVTSVLLALAKNKILELIEHLNQQDNGIKEDN